jgi:hypothetical protein
MLVGLALDLQNVVGYRATGTYSCAAGLDTASCCNSRAQLRIVWTEHSVSILQAVSPL